MERMERPTKRPRPDNGYSASSRRDGFEDPAPSPVVFLNSLPDHVTSEDVIADLSSFGPISYVVILAKRRQALVEFEDVASAVTLVEFSKKNPVYVGGRPVHATFSTSQKLERQDGARAEERPNNVLLYTILNPMYPITVDVLNTISSSHGKVNRIVIFRKQGVQAMVEYDTIEMSQRAKQALNGADIYSGCCTLKIEYARPTRLNVIRNDNDSWDYTNPSLGVEAPTRNQPLLADPPYPAKPYENQQDHFDPYGMGQQQQQDPYGEQGYASQGRNRNMMQRDQYGGDNYAPQDAYGPPGRHGPPQGRGGGHMGGGGGPMGNFPPRGHRDGYGGGYDMEGGPPSAGMLQQNSVVMMYGVNPEKMNCARVFNLFCIYGNIVRVKFLRSKEGSGMIQMGAPDALDRVCKFLNGTFFFGKKMNLAPSKQAFLQDVPNPYELGDGTKSFEDFMGNRNNRYTSPESASKNRIHPPSKTLYFWNAPPNLTEDQVVEVFDGLDCKLPIKVKIFPSKTEKSSTGLVEFDNKSEAVEAICTANHKEIDNPKSKYPYVFKLCFSENPIISKRPFTE